MIRAEDLIAKFQYALEEKWGYIWGTSGQVWTQRDQNNSSREMTVKYGSRWIGCHVADCSGLFRWAYRQLGTDCAHGSNSIYDRYCKNRGRLAKGKRQDGGELKPGTAVFTGTDGDRGHIGLYIGGGEVIEAKGTQYGVVKSKVTKSRWTWWGELSAVDYAENPNIPSNPEGEKEMKTIRRGDKGAEVKEAQEMLMRHGYKLPKYGADGDFGAETEKAVKQFQKDWDLTQDGVIGPKTWAMLMSAPDAPKQKTYRVTINGLDAAEAEKLLKEYPKGKMEEEV